MTKRVIGQSDEEDDRSVTKRVIGQSDEVDDRSG